MYKLKILMIIAAFYPYTGGAEKQAQRLASKLQVKGAEVSVVTGRWSNRLKSIETINGLKIYRNITNFNFFSKKDPDIGFGIFETAAIYRNTRLKTLKMFFRKTSNRLKVYIYQASLFLFLITHRKEYDIIHAHQVLYPAFVSALCGKILKKPVIAKAGNSGFNSDINQIKQFPEGKLQLRFIFNNIAKIVCTTLAMKEEFLDEGLPEEKTAIIHNGIAVKDYKRSYKNCDSILFVGRFIKNKNIIVLLYAFLQIINTINKDAKLIMAGDGPEMEPIKKYINELGFGSNTVLTGMISNPEKYIKECDVFMLPSNVEGLSNSLIEAMSYGMPCIVSNISGNLEVMGNGRNLYEIKEGGFIKTEQGLLFEPSDTDGLVNAYNYLRQNEQAREKIGKGAAVRIKAEFDIEIIAGKYLELYREISGK